MMQASVREQRHVVFMSLQPLCCFCCLSYFVSICSAKKVEEDTGDYHVDRVSTDFSRALAQARRNKGMTQAQLAQAINEKPSVVSEYESGKESSLKTTYPSSAAQCLIAIWTPSSI